MSWTLPDHVQILILEWDSDAVFRSPGADISVDNPCVFLFVGLKGDNRNRTPCEAFANFLVVDSSSAALITVEQGSALG